MKSRGWIATCALVGAALGGCGWFEDPSPQSVRVRVDGTAGDSLVVVTSTVFVAAQNELGTTTVSSLQSDTAIWVLPVNRTFDIREDQRFMLLGLPADSLGSVAVDASIQIDDRTEYVANRDLTWVAPLLFLFLFNQPILSDFEIL